MQYPNNKFYLFMRNLVGARMYKRLELSVLKFTTSLQRIPTSLRMKRVGTHAIPNIKGEIRLFMVVKNEEKRLEFILKYYLNQGVDRIILLDNNSCDETVSIALNYDKCHIFETKESYKKRAIWIYHLINKYGVNNWCLLIDVDEMLIYPEYQIIGLKKLCLYLDSYNFSALRSTLIEMYSNLPLSETKLERGSNPLNICPFFDKKGYIIEESGSVWGGVRERVFNFRPFLTKYPLIKYKKHMPINRGLHAVFNLKSADITSILLHFKFFSDFPEKASREAKRKVYWNKGYDYQRYDKLLKERPDILFCDDSYTTKFQNLKHFMAIGLIKISKNFINFLQDLSR